MNNLNPVYIKQKNKKKSNNPILKSINYDKDIDFVDQSTYGCSDNEKYNNPDNPVTKSKFYQPYTHKDGKFSYTEHYFVSDDVLENFAHIVTFCKDGQPICEKYPEEVQMTDSWYKCFSKAFYPYQHLADRVKSNYLNIKDPNVINTITNKEPYIFFINGSISLVKDYLECKKDPTIDKQYMQSLTEYYNCYIQNLKQIKMKYSSVR